MNRRQANLILRHRDSSGALDFDMLRQAQREREEPAEEEADPFAELRVVRRMQGWPEYLIEKSINVLRAADG